MRMRLVRIEDDGIAGMLIPHLAEVLLRKRQPLLIGQILARIKAQRDLRIRQLDPVIQLRN